MSGFLGFLLGVMPVLKYGVPLILLPLSTVWMVKNSATPIVKLGFFGIQYCLFQVFLIVWHSYTAGDTFNLSEQNLLITYVATALLVVPFANLVYSKFDQLNVGIHVGIWGSISVFAVEYFYYGHCRAEGFSSNPLIPPFVLVPLFGYFTGKRLIDGRAGILDFLTSICLVVAVSAFGGNRMAFYILILSYFLAIIYKVYARDLFKSILIFCSLLIGVVLSIFIDSYSGCNFWDRIQNQTAIISSDVNILADVAKTIPDEGVKPAEIPLVNPQGSSVPLTEIEGAIVPPSLPTEIVEMPETEHSTLQRLVMWTNSVEHLKDFRFEWILGVGRAGEKQIANEFTNTSYSHVHNQYLSWILEGGIIGVLSAFLLFGALPFVAFRSFPVFIFMFAIASGFLTNSLMLSGEASSQLVLIVVLVQVLEWRRMRH